MVDYLEEKFKDKIYLSHFFNSFTSGLYLAFHGCHGNNIKLIPPDILQKDQNYIKSKYFLCNYYLNSLLAKQKCFQIA